MYPGVYAVGHARLGRRARLIAALDACGTGALLSHLAAAHHLELLRSNRIEITIVGRGRRAPRGVTLHQVRHLYPDDRTKHEGLPVTSLARTLLDVAETAPSRLRRAFDEAERRRLIDMTRISELIERSRGRHGLKPLLSLIAEYDGAPDTKEEMEARFVDFCRERGLPMPAFNVVIEGFEVDATWPAQKLIVELDSWSHHGGRTAFESDRVRDATLQLAGYRILRITWRRLHREPDVVEATIRKLLAL